MTRFANFQLLDKLEEEYPWCIQNLLAATGKLAWHRDLDKVNILMQSCFLGRSLWVQSVSHLHLWVREGFPASRSEQCGTQGREESSLSSGCWASISDDKAEGIFTDSAKVCREWRGGISWTLTLLSWLFWPISLSNSSVWNIQTQPKGTERYRILWKSG